MASIEIIRGDINLLDDPAFNERWKNLYDNSIEKTPFQSPSFVNTWFQCYRHSYTPIFYFQEDHHGHLLGLIVFAKPKNGEGLYFAGTHHAEYQCWLTRDISTCDFFLETIKKIQSEHAITKPLKIKYQPFLARIKSLSDHQSTSMITHENPYIDLMRDDILESLKKKNNKSKINRLQRLGTVEFIQVNTYELFDYYLEKIVEFYDFRQGAVNGDFPFSEDSIKLSFHKSLYKNNPNIFHFTITTLNGVPISAHLGVINNKEVHLAILAYSPFYSEHSPGKLHILHLSKMLREQGYTKLDLTPGGDPWKERFANSHETVGELVIFATKWDKKLFSFKASCVSRAKELLKYLRVDYSSIKRKLSRLRTININTLKNRLTRLSSNKIEMRIYRHTVESALSFCSIGRFNSNSLHDLLLYTPSESWQSKNGFCSSSLARFETGERCFSYAENGLLLHYGWLIESQKISFISEVQKEYPYPDHSCVLYDFYTHPSARGRGLYQENIRQMLLNAKEIDGIKFIYISVLANNSPSRHVIEKLGFEYQGSVFSD